MTALIATDLDRTLIYSANAIRSGAADDAHADRLRGAAQCVELYQQRPQSYMSLRAIAILRTLATSSHVVPVTTRTLAQYQRISLPIRPRFAVTSNGGTLVVDGVVDEGWRGHIGRVVAEVAPPASMLAVMARHTGANWMTNLRVADDLFCYAVVRLELVPDGLLNEWAEAAIELGWNLTRQGRKVYAMPNPLTKIAAISEVARRLRTEGSLRAHESILAAGDGALDRPLLTAADAAIRPRHGELEEIGFRHERVAVTTATGLAASEEMLEWLLRQSSAPTTQSGDPATNDAQLVGMMDITMEDGGRS